MNQRLLANQNQEQGLYKSIQRIISLMDDFQVFHLTCVFLGLQEGCNILFDTSVLSALPLIEPGSEVVYF